MHSCLLDKLACPVTGQALQANAETLSTADSQHHYPLIAGIPWLLPNPHNSLADWTNKLQYFHQILSEEIGELQEAVSMTSGATQQRLSTLLAGKEHFIRSVVGLLAPIVHNPMTSDVSKKNFYAALIDVAPSTQNLLSYEANLYRDWVWGDEENQLSLDIVANHLDSQEECQLLVLGAGAGRLAWDLHHRLQPDITVATDINPLLVLATQHILNGNNLSFYEFPTHPKNSETVAIEHTIAGQTPAKDFHYVFADATKPAFIKAGFNTVVTPWLIDIQPLELNHFLQQLNQYIGVDDQWVNFGSLVFYQERDALCYAIEEIQAIAEQQGFRIENIEQHQMPYLKSPYNAGYRVETVWSWRATKTQDVEPIVQPKSIPDWLIDTQQPITKEDYFQRFCSTHRLYAQLSAEVDGRTSLNKIANKFAKQQKVHPEEAKNLVYNFFMDVYRQNQS